MSKITVIGKPFSITIHSKYVTVGFFTGKIGGYTGLFFRSDKDITFLSKPQGGSLPFWGYKLDSPQGCDIENYSPVDVKIEIEP